MKRIALAIAAAAATLVVATPASAQVNQRQWNQQHRIYGGAYTHRLTPREYYRLQRQQGRIARYEARSRWDGGGLSRYERARLDHMQDRASRNIYRQKHDQRVIGYGPAYGLRRR